MKGCPYRDQPADPGEVPRLRCREDPLTQPPYARLNLAPVDLAPVKRRVLWSAHHDQGRGVQLVLGFRDHIVFLFTGSPDRVSALSGRATRARIRPVIRDDPLEGRAIVSRFPAAFRLPAFASRSSHSRRGVQLSSRSAYRPTAGPRRGYRVPHARVATGLGALCTPGTTVLIPAGARPQPASAAFSTASPCTPPQQPIMRGSASRGINESSSNSPVRSSPRL